MVNADSGNGIDMGAIPQVNSGLDMNSMLLSSEEGLMLSRIDGQVAIGELIQGSGLGQARAVEVLKSLNQKGVVSWEGASQPIPAGEASGEGEEEAPWGDDFVFDPFELGEEVDLDRLTRKKMLYLYRVMEEMTHYEILGLNRRADAKDIKRAYFKISREFHPDTYFRKNLGSYRSKIEALFKRAGRAYEILSDGEKREEYDASLPYEPEPEEIERQQALEKRKERDERLAQERKARLLKRSPIGPRKAKAQRYYQDALAYKNEKAMVKAANSIKLALTLDPTNEAYKQLLEEVGPKASEIRADKEFRRGQMEESVGRYEEALEAYTLAIENCPTESRALARAVGLMLELKRDLRQALVYARRAIELEPDNHKLLLPLAQVYIAMDMKKNAVRELSRYVEMNPIDEHAATMLKELKKSSKL